MRAKLCAPMFLSVISNASVRLQLFHEMSTDCPPVPAPLGAILTKVLVESI